MPPILSEKQSWTRTRKKGRGLELTSSEQQNVKRALGVLRTRLGGWDRLAKALGVPVASLAKIGTKLGRPSAGVALHAARLARVPVEELLAGGWPMPGACPHCGQLVPKVEQ